MRERDVGAPALEGVGPGEAEGGEAGDLAREPAEEGVVLSLGLQRGRVRVRPGGGDGRGRRVARTLPRAPRPAARHGHGRGRRRRRGRGREAPLAIALDVHVRLALGRGSARPRHRRRGAAHTRLRMGAHRRPPPTRGRRRLRHARRRGRPRPMRLVVKFWCFSGVPASFALLATTFGTRHAATARLCPKSLAGGLDCGGSRPVAPFLVGGTPVLAEVHSRTRTVSLSERHARLTVRIPHSLAHREPPRAPARPRSASRPCFRHNSRHVGPRVAEPHAFSPLLLPSRPPRVVLTPPTLHLFSRRSVSSVLLLRPVDLVASLQTTMDPATLAESDPSLASGHRVFYEREVPFELRTADGLEEPDEVGVLEAIKVKILGIGPEGAYTGLRVELTSESNIFFHYVHELDRRFSARCRRGRLMVAFGDYPAVILRELDRCVKEPHAHLAIFVMMKDGSARLDFVQNVEYKFVELLSIKF